MRRGALIVVDLGEHPDLIVLWKRPARNGGAGSTSFIGPSAFATTIRSVVIDVNTRPLMLKGCALKSGTSRLQRDRAQCAAR